MKTSKIILGIIAAVLVVAAVWLGNGKSPAPQAPDGQTAAYVDYKNATYIIGGQPVTLVNGLAESEAAPGSAEKIVTRYFGNEARGDLDGDGIPDVAFLLTQSGGGTGTFYYVVAALKTPDGYQGTNAVPLGDRIAPQATEIRNRQIIVNYADRKPGEPMTAIPSVGVSKYFETVFGELQEASPAVNSNK